MDTGFLVFIIISLLIMIMAYCVATVYIFDRLVRIERLCSSFLSENNKLQGDKNAKNIKNKEGDNQ
jgi:hypothetical protein